MSMNNDLKEGLANALKQRQDSMKCCEFCGSTYLTYLGLGVYECTDCKKLNKTNYAKAREFVESHDGCTIAELIDGTDLTKADVDMLLESGSLAYVGSRIGITTF